MNYKELVRIALLLISSPAKAWEEISIQADKRMVFSTFVYPMIGLCGISVFIGSLLSNGLNAQNVQFAMTRCCAIFVALFGGYFLAAYAVNKLGSALFQLKDDALEAQQFIGYALVVNFILTIIVGVLPSFFILRWIFQFYTIYVVWEGAKVFMLLDEKRQMPFTLLASLLIIICPALIEFVFNRLTTILN